MLNIPFPLQKYKKNPTYANISEKNSVFSSISSVWDVWFAVFPVVYANLHAYISELS